MMDFTDILLGILAAVLSVATFLYARKKDNREDGVESGTLSTELTSIRSLLEDVRDETREIKRSVSDHGERIAKCEAKITSALTRIERIERQLDKETKEA